MLLFFYFNINIHDDVFVLVLPLGLSMLVMLPCLLVLMNVGVLKECALSQELILRMYNMEL